MPVYEYRCRSCDARFELRRPIAEADAPTACPDGHADTTRLLSVFAAVGSAAAPAAPVTGPTGGGCGPGCACAH